MLLLMVHNPSRSLGHSMSTVSGSCMRRCVKKEKAIHPGPCDIGIDIDKLVYQKRGGGGGGGS